MTSELRLNPSGSFRVPAEWEPLACVWIAWPHQPETWPGRFGPVPPFFARWARLMAESIPVRILAAGDPAVSARDSLGSSAGIDIVDVPTNDCWVRDYGPSFVLDRSTGRLRAVDWRYNAWGGKYAPWEDDDAAAQRIAASAGIPVTRSELCLEGGALETDGRGRLLTTPECLLTDTRNPGWTADEIAGELHRQLGVTEIVWLDGGGLAGDDTDGHIDQLARFVSPTDVVAAVCDDTDDPNHAPLEENYRQLRLWGGGTDPKVDVHRLPIPPARFIGGQRVPESYCNFLRLGPERLLVPTFGTPETDAVALGVLAELAPQVDVTGVPCGDLVWGLGALHCASRDQPASGNQGNGR